MVCWTVIQYYPICIFIAGSTTMNHNIAAHPKHYSPNSHLHYNQDSPHLSSVQSSWQTRLQSQTASFPIRALHQPQCSSHVPPYFIPPHISTHPHALQLHHLNSAPSNQHPRPPQPDYPWSWAAGAAGIPSCSEALWGQLYTEQLPPHVRTAQVVGEETDTSSKRERGGGSRSSRLSQELDVKPGGKRTNENLLFLLQTSSSVDIFRHLWYVISVCPYCAGSSSVRWFHRKQWEHQGARPGEHREQKEEGGRTFTVFFLRQPRMHFSGVSHIIFSLYNIL